MTTYVITVQVEIPDGDYQDSFIDGTAEEQISRRIDYAWKTSSMFPGKPEDVQVQEFDDWMAGRRKLR